MNQSIEIDLISGDKMPDKKVMNRWLVVVGALLIQLCLGAIYAWSVFTPPLVAPLPDEDFTDTALIDGFEIAIMDDLELDEKNEISFTITTGDAKADATNISVTMELRDHKNGLRKDDDGDEDVRTVLGKRRASDDTESNDPKRRKINAAEEDEEMLAYLSSV